MKDLWFEAYESLCDGMDREPTDAEVEAAYRDRVDTLCDHADMERKRAREVGQ